MAGHITSGQADRRQDATGSTPYAVLSTRQSSLVLSPCHLTLPFSQHHQMVCQPAGKAFLGSVRPDDVDGIHPFRLPQAEVSARVIAATIAGTWVDPTQPAPAPGPNRDLGPVGVAPQSRVESTDE